jgi:hypothetical protein
MPDPSQTLRPRPPTEIDLDILSGLTPQNKSSDEAKVADTSKTNMDLFLDPNITDIEPDIKLQDTAVNMQDFDDLEAAYNNSQNFKMMIFAIIIVILIVASGLFFVFNGDSPVDDPVTPTSSQPSSELVVPQLKSRE